MKDSHHISERSLGLVDISLRARFDSGRVPRDVPLVLVHLSQLRYRAPSEGSLSSRSLRSGSRMVFQSLKHYLLNLLGKNAYGETVCLELLLGMATTLNCILQVFELRSRENFQRGGFERLPCSESNSKKTARRSANCFVRKPRSRSSSNLPTVS